jgi:hypothetical protein
MICSAGLYRRRPCRAPCPQYAGKQIDCKGQELHYAGNEPAGYFKTPLNQALVDNPEFSSWLEKRTPALHWENVDELIGAALFLSGEASTFVNDHTL